MVTTTETTPAALIITGMHRSGTSLIASYLHQTGINLGKQLLPPNYGNPQGYFEDVEFLEFHRSVLKSCCRQQETGFPEWGWTESEFFAREKLANYQEAAQKLITQRQSQSQLWGWKDPRTSIILDFWHQLLPQPRYLLVYRYPWDVVDSIQRLNLTFFLEKPDYALKIWYYYNRHLLDFYQQNSPNCLLVSINAVVEEPEKLLALVSYKLGLTINPELPANIYRANQLRSLPFHHPLIHLLNHSNSTYFNLLQELDQAADLPSFSHKYKPSSVPPERQILLLHHESIKAKLNSETPQFLSFVSGWKQQYQSDSGNFELALTQLRQARQILADFWCKTDSNKLKNAWLGLAGKAHQAILESGIRDEPFTTAEQDFAIELAERVKVSGVKEPQALQYIMAAMLYWRADQLPISYEDTAVPEWFLNDLLKFFLYFPRYFQQPQEVQDYWEYMEGLSNFVRSRFFQYPTSPLWQEIARTFANRANFIPLCFTEHNLKAVYSQRADIVEYILRRQGEQIDCVFPARSPNGKKIRLGILKGDFTPISETFTTLPVFEYLDREQFEIFLYVLAETGTSIEKYAQSRVDKFVKLPPDLRQQVATIRADDLDILFFGSIVTNAVQNMMLLAMHRLARVQATYFASPVTTGIANMDYYIAGNLTEPLPAAGEQYRERLVRIEGTGFCFNYTIDAPEARIRPNRQQLGIPEDAVLFMSGANCLKILPQVRESWAKIMAAVPNSVLLLYPFSATWSATYPRRAFSNSMHEIFAKYRIADNRLLILLNALPSRADVKELLKLADVYLDSYPYGGANSTVDPLEVGLPTLVMEGDTLRSRQAAALLRQLEMLELIALSEEDYIHKGISLGVDPQWRRHLGQQIQQKMQGTPPFLNPRAYGEKLGNLFQQIFLQKNQ